MALKDLENIEEYLRSLTHLEINLKSDTRKNVVRTITRAYLSNPSTYEDPLVLQRLKSDLERMLQAIVSRAGTSGRLMSSNALEQFISSQEATMERVRQQAAARMLTTRQANDRLEIYFRTLQRDVGVLASNIDLYKLNMRAAGISPQKAIEQLVTAGKEGVGLAAQFEKSAASLAVASARREAQSQALAEYIEQTAPGEDWEWITISTNTCPDCMERGGKVLPLASWQQLGTPGEGRTICGPACMCQLIPHKISSELFPEQKSYKYDLNKTVLTTAQELRTLNSKKAQK